MGLSFVNIAPKKVSKWCDYKDANGNVQARFKIRGSAYKSYQSAIERAKNQVSAKGFDVDTASESDRLFHELLFDAVAVHLIEDWQGIDELIGYDENDQPIKKEVAYTTEKAKEILVNGDIGILIWNFVKEESEKMQAEADAEKVEILGKSKSYTAGQNTEATQKQATKRGSKTQSQKV